MQKNEFFGSKLNSILLFILIILMIIAIKIMLENKELYLDPFSQNEEEKIDLISEQIYGNKDDLVSFSILPNAKVKGVVSYNGVVKGGYFFEGNILINILDINKNYLKKSNANATTDWMISGPVVFKGSIDFSGLEKGSAYLEIHNDNASGLPEHDKSILIPIVIE